MGATCEAGTTNLSEASDVTPRFFVGFKLFNLVFCVLFCHHCLSFVPFLLAIVLSTSLQITASDYPFGIFWLPLWWLLITPLVSSDYPFAIFLLPLLWLLITPLVSSDYPFGWLLITRLVSSDASDYPFWYLLITPFGIFWLPFWYLLKEIPFPSFPNTTDLKIWESSNGRFDWLFNLFSLCVWLWIIMNYMIFLNSLHACLLLYGDSHTIIAFDRTIFEAGLWCCCFFRMHLAPMEPYTH